MMRNVGLACLLAAASPCLGASITFEEYAALFDKEYTREEEVAARGNFRESLQVLKDIKFLNPQATFALNKHADVSHSEWRRRFGGGYTPHSSFSLPQEPKTKVEEQEDRPVFEPAKVLKIDWREQGAVDPTIYDQGECGCCWAISVAQTVGSQWFLAKNKTNGTVPALSFQQLICCDCKSVDAGCHGGDPHMAYGYIQRAGGLESYAEYPFTDSGPDAQSCNLNGKCGKCKFSEDKVVTTITGYQNVTWTDPVSGNPGDEKKLADAVATNGPLSVCIDSDPWRFYEGGILTYGARSNINHCVQLIGYDSANPTPYWILKNSWGKTWGENGYIRMQMGMDICGVADVSTLPLI